MYRLSKIEPKVNFKVHNNKAPRSCTKLELLRTILLYLQHFLWSVSVIEKGKRCHLNLNKIWCRPPRARSDARQVRHTHKKQKPLNGETGWLKACCGIVVFDEIEL